MFSFNSLGEVPSSFWLLVSPALSPSVFPSSPHPTSSPDPAFLGQLPRPLQPRTTSSSVRGSRAPGSQRPVPCSSCAPPPCWVGTANRSALPIASPQPSVLPGHGLPSPCLAARKAHPLLPAHRHDDVQTPEAGTIPLPLAPQLLSVS